MYNYLLNFQQVLLGAPLQLGALSARLVRLWVNPALTPLHPSFPSLSVRDRSLSLSSPFHSSRKCVINLVFSVPSLFPSTNKGNGIAVHGTPSHSYGVSLAMWDHTVLPATRHK